MVEAKQNYFAKLRVKVIKIAGYFMKYPIYIGGNGGGIRFILMAI